METAIANARRFYENIMGALLVGIAERAATGVNIRAGEGEAGALAWSLAAASLAKRIERSYNGCEAFLALEPPAPVIASIDPILQRLAVLPDTETAAEWRQGRGI